MGGPLLGELMVVTAVSVPDWVARQNMEHGGIESVRREATAHKSLRGSPSPSFAAQEWVPS